jgi:hypothetical protein
MIEILIVVLVLLWAFGYFGRSRFKGLPQGGNVVHLLLVIVLILIVVRLVR